MEVGHKRAREMEDLGGREKNEPRREELCSVVQTMWEKYQK